MKERFSVRSGIWSIFCLVLAGLVNPTNQRPLCASPMQCSDNTLAFGGDRPQAYDYMRALDDPDVMKKLLEAIVIQHKGVVVDTTGNAVDFEQTSTRRPLLGLDDVINSAHPSSTERPPTFQAEVKSQPNDDDASSSEQENSTERPLIAGQLSEIKDAPETPWEVTTIEPQQLVSPLTVKEYHFETTTIQPEPGIESISTESSVGRVETTTPAPIDKRRSDPTPPPAKYMKKKTKRPSPTKRPTTSPPAGGHSPTELKPTAVTDAKDQEKTKKRAGIQLPVRKDPIRVTKPPTVLMSATSKRPDKKPISISPQPVAKVRQALQGPGISNPPANPVSVTSNASDKPNDDDLISMLASISSEDDTDEDDEDEEDGKQASSDEEEEADSDNDDDDDDSADEENEERENYDYELDAGVAGDVISRVMEEVSALI